MELIGRSKELAAVEHLLDGAGSSASAGLLVFVGPGGSGKSAMAAAAAAAARARGVEVRQAARLPGQPAGLAWAQLLRESGADDDLLTRILDRPQLLDLDSAARRLVSDKPRLLVVDGVEADGVDRDLLATLTGRLPGSATVVVVTASTDLGLGRPLRLHPLGEEALSELLPGQTPQEVHAVWLASRGNPGAAMVLASDLGGHPGTEPLVHLALEATSSTHFLAVDWALVRWVEEALRHADIDDDASRARLMATLAKELLGDTTSTARRRALVDDALVLARRARDHRVLAIVLDARLHALWDPAAALDRLSAASEIIDLATGAHDDARLRQGLFWRFIALVELGRIDEAESALAAFAFAAAEAGDAAGSVMALARDAMLALLRGRLDVAERLIDEVAAAARRIRLPDAEALTGTLRGGLLLVRSETPPRSAADGLLASARQSPGHLHEATAAVILALGGELDEAAAELDRLLPAAFDASGPRWLASMADLAETAVLVGNRKWAGGLYDALLPYSGRLIVYGGANLCRGSVSYTLGRLALSLGEVEPAISHLREALALEERIGALPFVASTSAELASALRQRPAGPGGPDPEAATHSARALELATRLGLTGLLRRLPPDPQEWRLEREGTDWLLSAGAEGLRLRDSRGLRYLHALLAAAGQEVPALDLVAGGPGLVDRGLGPRLDDTARAAYRGRLAAIDAELGSADAAGDPAAAAAASAERQALVDELRRASGLGGRDRQSSPDAERARVNATRALRSAIERIAIDAPLTAAHLEASIRTGRLCRYQPAPGGPTAWRL